MPSKALEKLRVPSLLKNHPCWPQIHEAVVLNDMSAREICQKFEVKTASGNLAIVAVLEYNKRLREKHKALFETADRLILERLREEYLAGIRSNVLKAQSDHDVAMNHRIPVKKGSSETIARPDFVAARSFLDAEKEGLSKLGDVLGIGQPLPPQIQQNNDNRQITLMSLPKSVPSRPIQMIDARKEA